MVFVWYNLETEIITRTIHCTHSIICEFTVIRIFVNHWHTWKRNSSFRILYFFFFFKWTFKLCSSLKTRKPSRNNEVKGYESKLALSFEFRVKLIYSSSCVWVWRHDCLTFREAMIRRRIQLMIRRRIQLKTRKMSVKRSWKYWRNIQSGVKTHEVVRLVQIQVWRYKFETFGLYLCWL